MGGVTGIPREGTAKHKDPKVSVQECLKNSIHLAVLLTILANQLREVEAIVMKGLIF